MAAVYQCTSCKGLFKDIYSIRMHACRSVTQQKDSQNPSHVVNGTNAEGQPAGDRPNQVQTTSQQLNVSATGNVITSDQNRIPFRKVVF